MQINSFDPDNAMVSKISIFAGLGVDSVPYVCQAIIQTNEDLISDNSMG